MKKTIAILMVAGFLGTAGYAAATDTTAGPAATAGQDAKVVEMSTGKISQSFAGLVKKTDDGLVLETKNGLYQLEGLNLEDVVGKQVYITGVLRNDENAKTIYVVKADIKE